MRKSLFLGGLVWSVLAAVSPVAGGDDTGLLRDGQWFQRLRPDHPRLFLNADMLPALRERAATVAQADFDALKKDKLIDYDTSELKKWIGTADALSNDSLSSPTKFAIVINLFDNLPVFSYKGKYL